MPRGGAPVWGWEPSRPPERPLSTFNYQATPALIANIELGLSVERFARYLSIAAGDREHGLRLYAWNTALSEAIYGPLQALEIVTRNKIHNQLSAKLARADWYDAPGMLQFAQQNKLSDAKKTLQLQGRALSPPAIVAELSFGFWTGLLGVKYHHTLWVPHKLWRFYQSRAPRHSRQDVHTDYNAIRDVRNRVAHHECILTPQLPSQHQLIIDLTRTLCADTAAWALHHSRFSTVWSDPVNPWLASTGSSVPPVATGTAASLATATASPSGTSTP